MGIHSYMHYGAWTLYKIFYGIYLKKNKKIWNCEYISQTITKMYK